MEAISREIRKTADKLFSEGKIDVFIGYEQATVPLRSRPVLLTPDQKDEIERLVWDSFCTSNLAAYLQKYFENEPNRRKKREKPYPKIGVAVKGCDARSIVALQKERQVIRENLYLIGVPCQGMIDRRKVMELIGGKDIIEYTETGDGHVNVKTVDGEERSFNKNDVMQPACVECRLPLPGGVDTLLEGKAKEPGDGGYARIREFEAKTVDERWDYFEKEMSKCIRCNACRQACPTCWCKECFADHVDLKWIGVGNDLTDAMIFQIVRIFHQAGRCVECDACYNACPMGIDLRTYTKKMVKDVEEMFGYLPAFDEESVPPLATFSEQDALDFISDPDKG